MNIDTNDVPPSLPPPLPKFGSSDDAPKQMKPAASSLLAPNVRIVGLGSLGLGIGGLGGLLVAWLFITLVHHGWGVGSQAEWLVIGFALLPIGVVAVASTIEKPAVMGGLIAIAVTRLLYQRFWKGSISAFPRPPFDLVELATIAGIVWGLVGGIFGSIIGQCGRGISAPPVHSPSTQI